MPITGMETVLAAQLEAMITAETIAAGNAPPDPKSVKGLANGIAKAIIPFLVTNVMVNPGIATATPVGPGATAAPGMIS